MMRCGSGFMDGGRRRRRTNADGLNGARFRSAGGGGRGGAEEEEEEEEEEDALSWCDRRVEGTASNERNTHRRGREGGAEEGLRGFIFRSSSSSFSCPFLPFSRPHPRRR